MLTQQRVLPWRWRIIGAAFVDSAANNLPCEDRERSRESNEFTISGVSRKASASQRAPTRAVSLEQSALPPSFRQSLWEGFPSVAFSENNV